jgi:hypothetical protein
VKRGLYIRGKAAVDIHPNQLQATADMIEPHAAGEANPTIDERLHHHRITYLKVVFPLALELHDLPTELVAEDDGRDDSG